MMTAGIRAKRLPLLAKPQIRLSGLMDQDLYQDFRDQLNACPSAGPIVVALTTLGGDPEVARSMGDDIRLLRENDDREIMFLGKVAVYSAGATFMAAFPIGDRYLTKGTRLMVHERNLTKTVRLDGPLRSLSAKLKQVINQIEHSIEIEEESFRELVQGSQIEFSELQKRAPENWYIRCDEAKEWELIADVI